MNFSSFLENFRLFFSDFFAEVKDWLFFLSLYTQKKLKKTAFHFERSKDLFVDFLLLKRGRYSRHFLNTSFFFLIASAVIISPVIAQYYPTVSPSIPAGEDVPSELTEVNLGDETTVTELSEKEFRFEIIDYEVEKGDTLGELAEKFGISVDTIKWANSLKNEKLIPGQTLRIPPVTGVVHKVAPGDTVYSLAKKYKSDPQKIVNFPANDFADLETFALNIGQIIFIPDGVMPQAAPVYKPFPVPQFLAGEGGKFLWPATGQITQYPVSYHMALDIANSSAPPIIAAEGGTVSFAGCLRYGYGCHIIISHSDGHQTLYGHLSSYHVEKGEKVGRGQVIGKMGSTGRSTGVHLHFEVRKDGRLLNPLPFLSK